MASAKKGFRLFVAGKCTAIGQNDVRKKSKKKNVFWVNGLFCCE